MSIKKKLTLITLTIVSVICLAFGAVACSGSAKDAIAMYLLPQEQQLLDADFTLPKKIGKNDSVAVKWTSDKPEAIAIEDAGETYKAKVTLQKQVTEVTLTISAGSNSKSFIVRVDELSVYTFLDRYEFPQLNAAVKADFDLDTEFTVQGEKATIAWSIDSEYENLIQLNEAKNRVIVQEVEDLKPVKIKATFTYGDESVPQNYSFSVAPPLDHLQLVNRIYSQEGYPIDFSGYIVHVVEASESYGNATLYAIDDDFCSGYYFFRVKINTADIDKYVEGAHITVTGSTAKNYNGLWENNSNGTATVDNKEKIDPREHIYAMDTDLLAGAPSLLWHESTFVSLSGWKVVDKPSSKPTGADSNLFALQRGDKKITVRITKYAQRTDEELAALLAVYDNVNEGDFVNVTGLLGYYNGFQIQPILASDITKSDAEGTNTDGAKVKAAVDKVAEEVNKNFANIITTDKDITMPTTVGDVAVSYRLAGENLKDPTVTVSGGTISVKPVSSEKSYDIEVTYSIGDYKAYSFFKLRNWKKTDAELVEEVKTALEALTLETVEVAGDVKLPEVETYGGTITWELGAGAPDWIKAENGKITITSLPTAETTVTLVASITVGTATGSATLTLTVAAAPALSFKAIDAPAAGTYKLAMDKNGTMLYFTGEMSGYYYGTDADVAAAADVVLAGSDTDGWTLKTGDKFLEIEYAKGGDGNMHTNVKLMAAQTAGKTWKWDATNKVFTWTVEVNGTPTTYFLGTDSSKDYKTISANTIDKISTYCTAKLGNMEGSGSQPSETYFEITPANFNGTLAGLTTSDLAENTAHPEEFTIKPNGYIKTNSFGHRIAKVVTEVYGSHDNMKMYAATSADESKEVKSKVEKPEDLREIITYTFEGGTDDFYFVNPSTYNVQMYSIKIYYEGVGGGEEPEPEHVHDYKYTYDAATGWQHKGHCDVEGCDEPDITEDCSPVLNHCEKCDHTYTETEILDKLFALTGSSTVNMKGTYSLTGKVLRIDTPYDSVQYFNVTFTIKVGDKEIQCYRENSDYSENVKPGDTVTVEGGLTHFYNGTKEFAAGCKITKLTAGELTDEEKIAEALRVVTLPESTAEDIELPASTVEGVEFAWASDTEGSIKVEDGKLKVTQTTEQVSVKITLTASCGTETATKEFTIIVDAKLSSGSEKAELEYSSSTTTNMSGDNDANSVFGLDESIFTITSEKTNSGNNHVGLNKDGTMRLYKGETATLHIEVSSAYKIVSIKVTLGDKTPAKISDLKVVVGTATLTGTGTNDAGTVATYEVNATKVSLSNVNASSQIYISSIEVIYAPAEPAAANVAPVAILPKKEY